MALRPQNAIIFYGAPDQNSYHEIEAYTGEIFNNLFQKN